MSIFTDEEEYYGHGQDPWIEHERKKRSVPDPIKDMKKKLRDLRSNPSYSLDAQRDKLTKDIQRAKELGVERPGYYQKKNRDELLRSNPSYTVDAERKKIQKKQEEERQIQANRTQTPNVVKTVRILGDQAYGLLFTGEADLLAYQVRNMMRQTNLQQLLGERIFPDKTRITVQSFFGQDIITIDVSQSTGEEDPASPVAQKECVITLLNLPVKIQPMRNPGEVIFGETPGIDYIKTYYQFDVGRCSDCEAVQMTFEFEYDGENHCIYSLMPSCWGEVIDHGTDDFGDYFIWKAYTEGGTPYSRTGLGDLLLKAIISNPTGEICNTQKKINVDCCLKEGTARKVEIWWEKDIFGGPTVVYNGITLYKMPTSITTSHLLTGIRAGGFVPLYAIPEINGGCVPFEWVLTGIPGSLETSGDLRQAANYITPMESEGICSDPGSLTLTDRCGNTYVVTITPCCGYEDPLVMEYTSLQMSCDEQQLFLVTGGCAPWTWSLSGGGWFELYGDMGITYHAPTAAQGNADCASNPTITCRDCCGTEVSVQVAVNCYTPGTHALTQRDFDPGNCGVYTNAQVCGGDHKLIGSNAQGDVAVGSVHSRTWSCHGDLLSDCTENVNISHCCVTCPTSPCDCTALGAFCNLGYCGACTCPGASDMSGGWDTLNDIRTAYIKSQGCCPLNPFTGLPM